MMIEFSGRAGGEKSIRQYGGRCVSNRLAEGVKERFLGDDSGLKGSKCFYVEGRQNSIPLRQIMWILALEANINVNALSIDARSHVEVTQ